VGLCPDARAASALSRFRRRRDRLPARFNRGRFHFKMMKDERGIKSDGLLFIIHPSAFIISLEEHYDYAQSDGRSHF
jgi:hypothetical protein